MIGGRCRQLFKLERVFLSIDINGYCSTSSNQATELSQSIKQSISKEEQPDPQFLKTLTDQIAQKDPTALYNLWEELLQQKKLFNISSVNHIMHTLNKHNLYHLTEKIVPSLPKHIQPDRATFNILISSLCASNQTQKALKVHKDCKNPPDMFTYGILIDNLCKNKMLPSALEIYEEMKSNKIPPNVVILSPLIRECCEVHEFEKAAGLLGDARKYQLTLDATIYGCLIYGFCSKGKLSLAIKVYELSKKNGVEPTHITKNALIDRLCKNSTPSNIEYALSIYDEMKQQNQLPLITNLTYNGLICACLHPEIERMNDALTLLSDLMNGNRSPTIITMNQVLNMVFKKKPFRYALEYWERMKNVAKPNVFTYNIVLSHVCKNRNLSLASAILKEMKDNRIQQDDVTKRIIERNFKNQDF